MNNVTTNQVPWHIQPFQQDVLLECIFIVKSYVLDVLNQSQVVNIVPLMIAPPHHSSSLVSVCQTISSIS